MKALVSFILLFLPITVLFSQTIIPPGPINLCQGSSQVLTVTGTPGGTTFQWQNPLGTNISGATFISYTANAAGNYYVILNGGAMAGDTLGPVIITIVPLPSVSFTFNPNNVCANTPVSFTNTSTGSGLTFLWNFGDLNSGANNTSTVTSPVHRFIGNPGIASQSYTVKLVVTNNNGCKDSITATVTNMQRPGTELNGTGATTYNGLPYFSVCTTSPSASFSFTNNSSTQPNSHYRIYWFNDPANPFDNTIFSTPVSHSFNRGTDSLLFIVTGSAPNFCIDTAKYYIFVGSNPSGGLGNPGGTYACMGTSFTFPFDPIVQNNTPGTDYFITVNDGTGTVHYTQANLPLGFTHIFDSTSCGTAPNNTFTITYTISNPCGETPGTIGGIRISKKAVAAFSISPKDTVCQNTVVTFTNTGSSGSSVPPSGSGACVPGKSVWKITPSSGWTLSGGNLGSENGNALDPVIWTTGSNAIQVLFNTPGTYSIKLKSGALCGNTPWIDSITKTICVNPTPVASFTIDQNAGCAPLTVNATNTSPAPFCGQNSYTWSVTCVSTAGCLPCSTAGIFINGTNASSVNPQLLFSNPGIYTIGLITISPAGTCTSQMVTQVVTVKGKPVVTINGLAPICLNQCANPTATATCYTSSVTYSWTFPGGTPSSSALPNPGCITYPNAGTWPVTLSVTNECGTTVVNSQIVVDSVSIAIAGPNQTICGTSAIMAANTPVIGTGMWSRISGGPPFPNFTPNANTPNATASLLGADTYIFRWTITQGACMSFSDDTITVVSGPTAANAGPDQNLCMVNSTTLAGNTPVVGTGIWTCVTNCSLPLTILSHNSPTTIVNGLGIGVYTFRWTTSFSNCTPSSDTVQITISDNPTVSNAGPDQTICGDSTAMAGNTPVVGTGMWTKKSGPFANIITPNSPTTSITQLSQGTYVFKWTISNGTCPPNEDSVIVNVTAIGTIANAGPDQTVCATDSITLTGNTPVAGTGQSFCVPTPCPFGVNFANPFSSTTRVGTLTPGNVYRFEWRITNGVCPVSHDTLQINNLDSLQNQISAAILTICSGQPITITGNIATGGTGTYTYLWEQSPNAGGPWGPAPIPNTNQNYNTTLNSSACFRRKVSSLPCETYSNIICITVQASVTNNTITTDQSICINTMPAPIIGSLPAGGNGAYTYFWEYSPNAGGPWSPAPIPNTNQNYSPGVLTQTTFYRRTVSTSLCNGPQANVSNVVTITVHDNSKALFTGNPTRHCAPFDLGAVITVTPFPNRNGLYLWYDNRMFFGGNSTGIFPAHTIMSAGAIDTIKLVTTSQYGCLADSMEVIFTTDTTAIANFTKAPASGCALLNVTFTNTSSILNNSIQYFWIFGNGTFLNTTNPGPVNATYSNNPNYTDTTYFVTLKAFNGCDTTYHYDSVRVFPNSKARFSVDTTRGCSPFLIHINNTSPASDTAYYWDFGDGFRDTTHAPGPRTHLYNPGTITTYTIRLISQNICSRDTQMINIVVSPINIQVNVVVNGNQINGCAPHAVTFNNSSLGAAQIIWDFGDPPFPPFITPGNQSTVNHTYNNPGTYTANIRLQNDCSDTTIQRIITVFAPPVAVFTVALLRICTGQSVSVTNASANANAYEWLWGDGSSSTFANGSHNYASPGTYTISLVAKRVNPSGFVCTDTIRSQVTVIDKIPAQITVASGGRCIPYNLNVNAGNISGYQLVEWVISDSNTPPGTFYFTGLSASHVFNVAGVYPVKLVVHTTSGCADSAISQIEVFNPAVTSFIPNPVITCSHDTTVLFTALTTGGGQGTVNYQWLINGSIQGNLNPLIYHFQAPLNSAVPFNFTIQEFAQTSAGCTDSSLAGQLTILPLPTTAIKVSPSLVLSQPNYEFTFSDTTPVNPNKTFVWDMGESRPVTRIGKAVTYKYGNTGSYKVSLFVTDFATGCKAKDSVKVTILYVPGTLYVPNAFYPNSSRNELKTFLPEGIGLESYHLQIFDAWGKLIFETKELNPDGSPKAAWDGTYTRSSSSSNNGKPLAQDAYVWKIVEAKFKNGKDWEGMSYNGGPPKRFGTITLFK